MVRRAGVFLCLGLALTAGPMRLAEAAGDLARSLAEFDHDQNLEPADGGVGDEPGDAILDHAGSLTAFGADLWATPAIDGGSVGFAIASTAPVLQAVVLERPIAPHRLDRAHQRARLGQFLF
jgi:hypothetical protein